MADLTPWRRQIEDALAVGWGGYTFDDLGPLVDDGTMQLWTLGSSIILTQILNYPQHKQAYVFLAGGDLAGIEKLYQQALPWAKSQGCTHALMIGRHGWERTFLKRDGWTTKDLVCMEKPL